MKFFEISNRIKSKSKIIFYVTIKKIIKRKMIIDITGTLLTPGTLVKIARAMASILTTVESSLNVVVMDVNI